MTQIQQILEKTDVDDKMSLAAALNELKNVPEHELHLYLVMRDTLQATAVNTRRAIAFAQVEFERRKMDQTRELAYKTTCISGVVGLIGVVLGVVLAAYLKN